MTDTPDTDLIIVGGGPAGCSAAVMAASLGMRSVLVEPDAVCRRLRAIPALSNVLGGFSSGRDLAAAITEDVERAALCRLELGRRVVSVRALGDRVEVRLDDGRGLVAPHAVVAAGVAPLTAADAGWLSCGPEVGAGQLWEAEAAGLEGRDVLVLGGDRPLGTVLRAHPHADLRLRVLFPDADGYKTEEVSGDPRVRLVPVVRAAVRRAGDGTVRAEVTGADGAGGEFTAVGAYLNLGGKGAPPDGDLVRDGTGYCPPDAQHPRVLVAGDLRGVRNQRIMTAFGSGAEAALRAYYAQSGR